MDSNQNFWFFVSQLTFVSLNVFHCYSTFSILNVTDPNFKYVEEAITAKHVSESKCKL